MIISRIIGGLGNQMFQYAAGLAVARRLETSLLLDVSGYASYDLHQGEQQLSRVFGCSDAIAQAADMRQVLGWQASPLMRRIFARPEVSALRKASFVVEPQFAYWAGIQEVPTDSYLYGYWQSERYFADEAEQVREAFTFQPPLSDRNAALAEQISGCTAVSLHVRRGDYLQNSANLSVYHECGPAYYQAAAQYLMDRAEALVFFVFSDDIAWCKAELDLGSPCHFIDHNQGLDSHVDMQLMSLCQHHIIANSSFSWWGAWLNRRADKIVIVPKNWFKIDRDTRDLCPAEWVRL